MLKKIQTLIAMLRDVHARVQAIDSRLGDVDRRLGDVDRRLGDVDGRLGDVDGRGHAHERQLEELRPRLEYLQTAANAAATKLNAVETLTFENGNKILSAFNVLNNVSLPDLGAELHETAAVQLASGANRARTAPPVRPRPHPDPTLTMEVALARGALDYPSVYGLWKSRLDETAAAFAETKVGNAAHVGDVYSRLFRLFVERHAAGQILDVGCGPFGVPFYLRGFPVQDLSGLEPLSTPQAEFSVAQGISEYLPWPEASFDTVISATSLDHCLSLDKSIDEMQRVLAPGGRILLWIGSNPGAPEFRPDAPDFVPADRYHLFHFDVAWFEPMLEQRFAIEETQKFARPGYSHVFYCLARLPAQPAQ